jgi:hypothetical protein
MRRVLRCDGIIPQYHPADGGPSADHARAVRQWLTKQGKPAGFDLIADGETPASDSAAAAAAMTPWAEAGCTWWLETRWDERDQMAERLAAGPPRPR